MTGLSQVCRAILGLWGQAGLGLWGQAGSDRAVPGVQGHPGVMGTGWL